MSEMGVHVVQVIVHCLNTRYVWNLKQVPNGCEFIDSVVPGLNFDTMGHRLCSITMTGCKLVELCDVCSAFQLWSLCMPNETVTLNTETGPAQLLFWPNLASKLTCLCV